MICYDVATHTAITSSYWLIAGCSQYCLVAFCAWHVEQVSTPTTLSWQCYCMVFQRCCLWSQCCYILRWFRYVQYCSSILQSCNSENHVGHRCTHASSNILVAKGTYSNINTLLAYEIYYTQKMAKMWNSLHILTCEIVPKVKEIPRRLHEIFVKWIDSRDAGKTTTLFGWSMLLGGSRSQCEWINREV